MESHGERGERVRGRCSYMKWLLRQGNCSYDRLDVGPVCEMSLGRQIGFPNDSEAQGQTNSIQTSAPPLTNHENWKNDLTSPKFSLFHCKIGVIIFVCRNCYEK